MQRPHRLYLIILAQFAAFGCSAPVEPTSQVAPPVQAPIPVPSLVPSPPPTPIASADAGVAIPAAAPVSTALTPPTKEGDACSGEQPCPPPLNCQLGFNGAAFSKTGTCTKHPGFYEGRPLLVDGAPRTAPLTSTGLSARGDGPESAFNDPQLAAMLTHAAREEHASIAAFARTVLQLMHLGAPTWLIAATQSAMLDEVRHAEAVLDAAVMHGAPRAAFGVLPEATAPFERDVAESLLQDVLEGGCIGETLAAFRAEERAERHPTLRALCTQIAEDEARHAALAFATARFVLARRPDLQPNVDAVLEGFRAAASAEEVARVGVVWRMLGAAGADPAVL